MGIGIIPFKGYLNYYYIDKEIDIPARVRELEKKKLKYNSLIDKIEKKFSNQEYLDKCNSTTVEGEYLKIDTFKTELGGIEKAIELYKTMNP